ncbi:hypothetical protein QE152_g38171 [Popillia japonica]|uniref:Uncharacterized protein n=1 Tax=Popillia japonica TaxID=7064 RepID=A0AAW1I8N5_POPJA
MSSRRGLTNRELFELMEEGLSDIEYLSEEDNFGWESDAISTPGEIQDDIDMDENAAAALAEEREDVSTISDSSESEAEDKSGASTCATRNKKITQDLRRQTLKK